MSEKMSLNVISVTKTINASDILLLNTHCYATRFSLRYAAMPPPYRCRHATLIFPFIDVDATPLTLFNTITDVFISLSYTPAAAYALRYLMLIAFADIVAMLVCCRFCYQDDT